MLRNPTRAHSWWAGAALLSVITSSSIAPEAAQSTAAGTRPATSAAMPAPVALSSAQDRQRQMDMLKITSFPSGPGAYLASTYDEATANPYPRLPDPLVMKNGTKVTTAAQWKLRRTEIREQFDSEVYGRTPRVTPKVTWKVTNQITGTVGDSPVVVKQLIGHVDNSAYPAITVDIQLTLTTPANATGAVPVVMQFGGMQLGTRTRLVGPGDVLGAPGAAGAGAPASPVSESFNPCALTSPPRGAGAGAGGARGAAAGGRAGTPGAAAPAGAGAPAQTAAGARAAVPGGVAGGVPVGGLAAGRGPAGPTWQEQVLAKGWSYAALNPASIQADSGCGLTAGIIGLVNKGQPRKMDDWGSLAAWAWGAGRAMDYFETDKSVDAKRVGLEGHSRYGKATVVTMAFDERFAIAYVSSSGEGGAKLHRRKYGEIVENLTSSSEYHWMAGNFMKYAGRWDTLPVDSHELIALCAPRPVFLSAGKGPNTNPDGTIALKPVSEAGVTPVVPPGTPDNINDAWVDAKGTFLAGVGAGPVYTLLGKKNLGTAEFPPIETGLMDGTLTFRQHSAGHTDGPNWPVFLTFAEREFKTIAPPRMMTSASMGSAPKTK